MINLNLLFTPPQDPSDCLLLGEPLVLTEENWMQYLNAQLEASELLEALGDIRAAIKFLDKIEGSLKEMLPTKFESEEWEFANDHYTAIRTQGVRVGLDTTMIKNEMPADWIAAHSKETEFFQLKVTPIKT